MKITDGRVIVCSPGRNFVTVKITTDAGIHGVGDATLNGRELAVEAYLTEHVLPLLEGRDPFMIEDIWHLLYKGAYWRRGPVTMTAIGAIDMALWDIKGKALETPVYNLLGGRARNGCMVYGHASGLDIDATVEAAAAYIDMGYRAVRVQSGIPDLPSTYGIGKGDLYYEPAAEGPLVEEEWSTEAYLHHIPALFERLRDELGWNVRLLHDVHHRLTPIEAASLGKRLEPYELFWLEDAVTAENQESFRIIRQHTTIPLAVGEIFTTVYDAQTLITEQLIDFIRMTVAHGGGLTHLQRVAHLAELYHVRTGCHGPTDLSPLNLAACLHLGLAIHNFGIQEYMRHSPETDAVFPHAYRYHDGMLDPGDAPGLGVDIDEERAAQHPYRRAYLPVNRKADGTVHSW